MTLTLITRKISYNNVLQLLELADSDNTYAELLNHPSSGYYNELAKILDELHYEDPLHYRIIYSFLLKNVWNEQPEHQPLNRGKIRFDESSFVDNEDVKELSYNNCKFRPSARNIKKAKTKKELPTKVKKARSHRNNNKITPLTPIVETSNQLPLNLQSNTKKGSS
jgi:hypothetical protein